jgi:hypothetical protein
MNQVKDAKTNSAGNQSLNSLIQINSLSYSLAPSLSLVTSRNHNKAFAQRSSYSNDQTIDVTLSTGSAYLCGPESFLCFKLNVPNSATAGSVTFGSAGANCLNLFKSITILHSSGTEIERISMFNLYSKMKNDWMKTTEQRTTINEAMGERAGSPLELLNTTLEFCIPMGEISDFFNQSQLIPSFLVSGLRVQIELEHPGIAFKSTTMDANLSYEIQDFYVWMSLNQLTDSAARKLSETSAQNGLEFSWVSVAVQQDQSSVVRRTLEVSKALSRVNFAATIVRDTALVTASAATTAQGDSFHSQPFPVLRYQYQLGSHYSPASEANTIGESYMFALRTFGRLGKHARPGSVSKTQYEADKGAIAQSFETSSTLVGSGSSVDAQRGLTLQIEFDSAGDRNVTTFVQYVKLASSYLSNIVIRS